LNSEPHACLALYLPLPTFLSITGKATVNIST
jgi:hypothetical protein